MSKEPCERALLTIIRSNLQGSCAWDGKLSSATCSSSVSALLHVRACSRATSVLLYQKRPRVCQKIHVKEHYCKPELKGGDKAAVPETVYDSLQLTYHHPLLFCVFAPVAARHQRSYVKIHLEYVKRDLEYAKRTLRKMPTDHKS
jgi:hypothetical protein